MYQALIIRIVSLVKQLRLRLRSRLHGAIALLIALSYTISHLKRRY